MGKSALLHTALRDRTHTTVLRGVRALADVPYLPLRMAFSELPETLQPSEIAARLDVLLGRQRVLVVDDLHWCDNATLAVIAELAMRRPLVVTTRPNAGAAEAVIDVLVAVGEVVEVHPLNDEDAATLVRRRRPGAPVVDVDRCVRQGHGRPLDLELLATHTGHAGDALGNLAIGALAVLSDDELTAFARLAIAGHPVELEPLMRKTLAENGFLTVLDDGRCEPRHDMLAEAALDLLPLPRRRQLHAEAADGCSDAAAAAVHLVAAGLPAQAVAAATEAMTVAPTVWSRAEFAGIIADHTDPPNAHAHLAAADAMALAGRYPEATRHLNCLDELLAEIGNPVVRDQLRPTALLARARVTWAVTDIDSARVSIAAALELDGLPPSIAAELLALRSRIRCRVDWDVAGGIDDGRRSVELAERAGTSAMSAHSALGLALLMAGDPAWQDELLSAGRLAAASDDLHNASTVYDTMFFGHLLAGDPARCAPLAEEMIAFTEQVSAAWNGYFRAISLITRLHVDGDHLLVCQEAEHLATRRLTVKAAEARRSAHAMAMVDSGNDLDAVQLATRALAVASDDSSRSTASWALAEALWLSGDLARAVEVADASLELTAGGFPGAVNAALAGLWAKRELGLPLDEVSRAATRSGFPNLAAAATEADALSETDPATACQLFELAAEAWRGVSLRSELRARWAAGVAALEAGDEPGAIARLRAVEHDAAEVGVVWLTRRVASTLRAAARRPLPNPSHQPPTGHEVMLRVARGQTSAMIAHALAVKPSTVESHIRHAMVRTGARTRLQAASRVVLPCTDSPRAFRACWCPDGTVSLQTVTSHRLDERPLAEVAMAPWSLSTTLVTGTVRTHEEAASALLCVLRGASIAVAVPAARRVVASTLLDELRRIGEVEIVENGGTSTKLLAVNELDNRLVALLAAGVTMTEAAAQLGYSRRTLQRRLIRLRDRSESATTAETVVAMTRALQERET